ncbi:piggyBac transposable element-derived protein 4-like [Sycon ciliatum]|uniref:piggyBac transposable element-derived protein 4-like n=1 Tax=Sycon ciliatum TaxID=27933 RepID=UPI0031F6A26B
MGLHLIFFVLGHRKCSKASAMAHKNLSVDEALAAVFSHSGSAAHDEDSDGESSGGLPSSEESELDDALIYDHPVEDLVSDGSADDGEEEASEEPLSAGLSRSSADSSDTSADSSEEDEARPRRESRAPTRQRGQTRAPRAPRGGVRGVRAAGGGRGRVVRGGAATAPVQGEDNVGDWDSDDECPDQPEFRPAREPGCHFPADFAPVKELDFFQLFFTLGIVQAIVEFTNDNAGIHILEKPSYQDDHGAWKPTDTAEIYALLGLTIYMGIARLPHLSHYWSTSTLFHGLWARHMIPTFIRYKALLCFLHIVDPTTEDAADKLRKVRLVNDHFQQKCRELFQPFQSIAIDERMVKSKARFAFKQYISNKPVRFGFKVFALCDSALHYLYNFKIYTGREHAGQVDHGLAHNIVTELLQPLSGQGYKLYTDNFYTSPHLFSDLFENHKTAAAGTCQVNRRGFPAVLKNTKTFQRRAERGKMRFVRGGDLLHLQWMDKRPVTVISTMHSAADYVNIHYAQRC